jgi:hypothetical protein
METNYPYIGLLVDTTSIEVYHPKARFEDAKTYWDAKNCIYALKVEVAVQAAEPHYALFVQRGQVGSKHDYVIFKENSTLYSSYTAKNN